MIKGVTVLLIEKTLVGHDPFGAPMYEESQVEVKNVLLGQPTSDDVITSTNIYGKQAHCVLGIPKGDNHNWQDTIVIDHLGRKWKTYGLPIMGIEANVPTKWHKKVLCEHYE